MIHVGITAHPRRKQWVAGLVWTLGGTVDVAWDSHDDRWDTAARAYKAAWQSGADHALIVQDDAIIPPGLVSECARIVQVADGRPVCLYVGDLRPHARQIRGTVDAAQPGDLLEGPGPWWAVALLLPCNTLEQAVTKGARNASPNVDHRLSVGYRHLRTQCLYTVPSLADHRRLPDNLSLVRGRTGDRHAMRFIGDDPPPDRWRVAGPIKP